MVSKEDRDPFKIKIHERITNNAFEESGLSPGWKHLFKKSLESGVGITADILGAVSDYHFDGRQNYAEVQSTWESLIEEINDKIGDSGTFNKSIGGSDIISLGKMIHTVQDFYSHSNYVELYIEYYKSINNEATPSSVPIYDVTEGGTSDSNFDSILKKKLRTGDFILYDNEFIDINPLSENADKPTSHNKMNKDKADTFEGKLAEKVATEHTTQILKQLKEKK